MLPVKRILYPTDFSSYSTQAYFHAVALAENHGAGLTVLYVIPPGRGDGDSRLYWREQLEQVRPSNPGIPIRHVLLEGDPAGAIVGYAADSGIDLIVMGTHGRNGPGAAGDPLLGSVAGRVMRDAPCSVLVVKLPRGVPAPETPVMGRVAVS